MARNYGTLEVGFWDDPHARRLSQDAIVLYTYLRSCRHSGGASAFVVAVSYIERDTRIPQERVLRGFHELSLKPFALRDAQTDVVYLPNFLGTVGNKLSNQNVAKYISGQLLGLPDCELKARAIHEIIANGDFDKIVKGVLGSWSLEGRQDSLPFGLPNEGQGNLLPPAEPPPPRDKKSATRLSGDWSVPQEYRQYAQDKGLSQDRIDNEAVRFLRYWTGPDATNPAKKDWFRTWCNWIDKVAESMPRTNGHRNDAADSFVATGGIDWPGRLKVFNGPKKVWLSSWGPRPGERGCEVPAEFLAPVG